MWTRHFSIMETGCAQVSVKSKEMFSEIKRKCLFFFLLSCPDHSPLSLYLSGLHQPLVLQELIHCCLLEVSNLKLLLICIWNLSSCDYSCGYCFHPAFIVDSCCFSTASSACERAHLTPALHWVGNGFSLTVTVLISGLCRIFINE